MDRLTERQTRLPQYSALLLITDYTHVHHYASALVTYCKKRACLSVCLYVRLAVIESMHPELHVRSSPYSAHVIRSSSNGVAIRYVLPVLRLTSYLHIVGHMATHRHRCSE